MMRPPFFLFPLVVFFLLLQQAFAMQPLEEILDSERKLFIARSGSAQNFGQNNIAATLLSSKSGTHFIECELVLTGDDQLVVFDDTNLAHRTNVAAIFPEMAREDGTYHIFDFTLSQLRSLALLDDQGQPVSYLHIPSFTEIIVLIQDLEKLLGREIGLYLRMIKTWEHTLAGKDLSSATLNIVKEYGYTVHPKKVFIQSYDTDELQRIHNSLMPLMQLDIPLVQLMGENDSDVMQQIDGSFLLPYNFDWMLTNFGIRSISTYADAIGLPHSRLPATSEEPILQQYVKSLQKAGLKVHIEIENNKPEVTTPLLEPSTSSDMDDDALLEWALYEIGADAVVVKNSDQLIQRFVELEELYKKKSSRPSIHNLLPHLIPETEKETTTKSAPLSILRELQ